MSETEGHLLPRYGVAVLAVTLAIVLISLPNIGGGFLSILFFAVLVSAWYGGMGPGIFANVLIVSILVAHLLRVGDPVRPTQIIALGMFAGGGLVICLLVEALHAARRRAESSSAESRRHQEVLRRSEQALKEADRRKDEFLAVLAHELRTPLAAISNAAQLLQLKRPPEEQEWSIQVIERQSAHLARLIGDLMDVSRVSQGKVQLARGLLDLCTVVKQAVEDVRPAADERRHRVKVILPEEPVWVEADDTRLRQIVVNLLTNAVKYTEPGGRIEATVARGPSEAVLRVRDTGVGISPDMLTRVFEMYTQVDRTLDRAQGGLGIGLTLVRRLAELHGGTVSAVSEGIGRGSEFIVRFPAAERPRETGADAAPAERPRSSRLNILVVDDNVDSARSLSRLLASSGHDVAVAHDGLEGLEAAKARRPDVVLLDLSLPGMDGYHVAQEIRRDDRQHDVCLIAISGYAREEDVDRSRKVGFDHHLPKPVDYDELQHLLARLGQRTDAAGGGSSPLVLSRHIGHGVPGRRW